MKKLFAVLMFISVALMGCQNKQKAQPYIPAPPLEVTTQSVTGPINLPSGAEVSVFSGWKIFKYEDHVEFLSPENDMRVGYYELSAEKYFSVNNALWSNAEDLGKFMIAELANQDPVHAKRWEPAITISGTMQYGFGFFLDQQNGIKTRYHGGAINGAKAQIAFYPDQNFAIAVMENDGLGGVNKIFETIASDIIFEEPENWSIDKNYDKKLPQAREILKKEANLNTKDLQLTPDAAWLNSLVGKYHGKELGDIEISIVNGKGVMKTPYWESEFGRKQKYGKDMLVMLQFPRPGSTAFEVKTRFGKVTKLIMTEDQKIAKYTYVLNKL